jgi:Sec-independent protein secretion pathway component TatC
MTQMLMAAPLTVLYVLSIGIAHLFSTKVRMDLPEDDSASD